MAAEIIAFSNGLRSQGRSRNSENVCLASSRGEKKHEGASKNRDCPHISRKGRGCTSSVFTPSSNELLAAWIATRRRTSSEYFSGGRFSAPSRLWIRRIA
jgi:hypothetical protein